MNRFDDIKVNRNLGLIAAILCCLLAPQIARCQSGSALPVPEYYGIYAATDGHLIKLDGKEVRSDRTVSVRMGQREAVSGVLNGAAVASSQVTSVPVLSPDLKIIVYSQSGGMASALEVAESLRIEPLVFLRNLSVDTGFPNNVRRSGSENGWEYGNAPELVGVASGDHPEVLELLKKPFPGQKDMVVAGFAEKLQPGVYRFTLQPGDSLMGGGKYFTFAVEPIAQAEASKCVDASITYLMMASNAKYRPCGSSGERAPSPSGAPDSAAQHASSCGDFAACFQDGQKAAASADWQRAITSLESATSQDPSRANPWWYLGNVYLAVGQTNSFPAAWDNVINLSRSLAIAVCRDRSFQYCEQGNLFLGPDKISFTGPNNHEVFSAPTSSVVMNGVTDTPQMGSVAFGIKAGGKKYNFEFRPVGVDCAYAVNVICTQQGKEQQLAVANYIANTLPKLVSGSLGATSTPVTGIPLIPLK